MKVSVVVPVWNPGPNLRRCVDSLLAQTMAAADYEVVFVDDGCTDGTADRLDDLVAKYGDRVKVLHIPNSGWPGKPRNVGAAAARGEYIQYVDNDDVLDPRALQALYDLGKGSAADVVIGKLSSNFRGVNHTVFRKTVAGRTIADFPLVESLTPHKMFRRAFLEQHDIRYPEGPTHLEDQLYVMRAYVKASSVAVLADLACYFYLRRLGSGRNAGDVAIVPGEYYHALEQVLDVIDADIPPGELRDRLYRRFYRVELLGRVSGPAMIAYADAYRRELAGQVRRIVTARVSPEAHAASGTATRLQGCLLRAADVTGLVKLAEEFRRVTLRACAAGPRWQNGVLRLDVEAALYWGDEPMQCERTDTGWAVPSALAPTVPDIERLLNGAVAESDVELSVVSRASSASFGTVDGLRVRVDDVGNVRVSGTVSIDPQTAMGGRPLDAGLWDLRLRLRFAGWSLGASLRPALARRENRPPTPMVVLPGGTVVTSYWTRPNPALAIDVDQWARSMTKELAAASVVESVGRGRLQVDIPISASPGTPLPALELMLQPQDKTAGGLVSADGTWRIYDGGAVATVRIPVLKSDGKWRVWFRLAEPGAAPAVALPWQVRGSRRGTVVERVTESA
ncbi:MAG: glycosyltransferase [Jatrophihabitans sp.]